MKYKNLYPFKTLYLAIIKLIVEISFVWISYLTYINMDKILIHMKFNNDLVIGKFSSVLFIVQTYKVLGAVMVLCLLNVISVYLFYLIDGYHITLIVYSLNTNALKSSIVDAHKLLILRFGQISGLFVISRLIRKSRKDFLKTLQGKIKTRSGILNLLSGGVFKGLNTSIDYMDRILFASIINDDEPDSIKALLRGLCSYVKNYGNIFKSSLMVYFGATLLTAISWLSHFAIIILRLGSDKVSSYIIAYITTCILTNYTRIIIIDHFTLEYIIQKYITTVEIKEYSDEDINWLKNNIPFVSDLFSKVKTNISL